MRTAVKDLSLEYLWIVYPGKDEYLIEKNHNIASDRCRGHKGKFVAWEFSWDIQSTHCQETILFISELSNLNSLLKAACFRRRFL